jgi:hypothetical protein
MPSRKFTLYFPGRVHWPDELGAHSSHAVGLLASRESATQGFTFDVGRMWKLDNASLPRAENDHTFHTLAIDEGDPANARWAASWLARLEKGVRKETLLAAMRSELPATSGRRLFQLSYR